jgi:hypothetical protein
MGTDINAYAEYTRNHEEPWFRGDPNRPALFFAEFSLSRDYALFDALGDGRNSQLASEDVGQRALFPPRGIPADLSLVVARQYYDLVIDSARPNAHFWPAHGCVTVVEAEERVHRGHAHFGNVVQDTHYSRSPPRTWKVVSKELWHTPSWLLLSEIHQAMRSHNISLTAVDWGFRVAVTCLSKIEDELGEGRVRLVFWFDD